MSEPNKLPEARGQGTTESLNRSAIPGSAGVPPASSGPGLRLAGRRRRSRGGHTERPSTNGLASFQAQPSRRRQRLVSCLPAAGRHRLANYSDKLQRNLRPDPTVPTNFLTRNSLRQTRNIGSARISTGATFSRVLFGAQISLLVGVVGAGVSLVIGVLWGAVAGYVGGRVDAVLMRIVDVLYSLPSVIFVIVLITTLGELLKQSQFIQNSPALAGGLRVTLLFVGLGAVSWLTMARIVRGQVFSLRTRAFVEASRALGGGPVRILARHIIPNIFGIVITYLALTMPAIILYESFFSYLGLGVQAPMASWGTLIFRRRREHQSHPHLLVADCVSRRRAGGDADGAEFSRRRPARRMGCQRPELKCQWPRRRCE